MTKSMTRRRVLLAEIEAGAGYTAKELSALLGISTRQLAQWRFRGQGPDYIKPVGTIIYLKADVERWLQESHRQTKVGA